ncbi:RING/U-box [Glarea lozoyensis ATCC 20868]|uniref:RING/U-box n=1 Tax=Glarea lozoyensis (strain ATCC 20868 / MF5171) TaxID=1116229 RepID=S3CHY7_GLAL2|nr:RING/U-box [Glarea lozoyensis ATCC 20868]EPE26092.1 RING/U-box [Glarea lozoyensis ATCC 20868]
MVLPALFNKSVNSSTAPRRSSRTSPRSTSSAQSSERSSSEPPPACGPLDHLYIHEEAHLKDINSEPPDLRELNNSLVALAAIFPDVQVEVFREMLSSFDEESRLAVVTEALLKDKMQFVRGRNKVAGKEKVATDGDKAGDSIFQGLVQPEEKFRSPEYKKAVKGIAYQEFKGLSRSTINGVLAEHNYAYTLARPTLTALSSKSWRFSISSLFSRRKTTASADPEHHPLVIWQSTGRGSIVPTLKATGSAELDKELFDALIVPINQKAQEDREAKDHVLAREVNNEEAEANEGLHDCECCFTATTFEELSACDDAGHFVCFQCVRHSVKEAVFGQGWQRTINTDSGTLRCIAAMSGECQGCISQSLIRRAFDEDKGEKDVVRKLDERLAEDSLLKTGLPLIRCPFCSYAEVDELYLPESQRAWRIKRAGDTFLYTLIILVLGVGMIPFFLPVFLLFSFLFILFSSRQTFGDFTLGHFHASLARLRRKQHGLKFVCQNSECRRASCISCSKGWKDIHICHESSLLALRTQVELAMSLAVKRTCPRCNTSFVKSSGCNKLTCICGYQMCYVCRKDIGNGEGYRHFCEHFRPNGGRGCTECSKCDLYRCEDDEVVVKKAKEEAERQWVEKEGTDLGGNEKVRKVLQEKRKNDGDVGWWSCHLSMPNWQSMLDAMMEMVVE